MSIMRSLTLQSNSTIVASGDEVGKLSFAASSEVDVPAAISVGARVIAQAEGSFQSASNPTSLVFATASSTEGVSGKIKITDNGNVMPMTNNTYDIGDQNLQFRNMYASSGNFTSLNASGIVLSQTISTDGSPTALTLTGAAHTTLTASTEATDLNFNLARTVQFATGALTTQRAMRIQAPTYGFVGASTITTASTLSISGPPVAGTNATITNAYALNVDSGYVNIAGGVLTGGTSSNAPTSSTPLLGLGGDGTNHGWLSLRGNNSAGFGRYGLFYDSVNDSTALFGYFGRTLTLGHMAFAGSYTPGWFFTANTLQQRSGTTAQSFQLYNTYTSATSYERLNVKGVASANFEIGPENGSAGGTLRGITLGGYTAGSATITPWLSCTNAGVTTVNQGTLVIASGGTGLLCQQTNIYLDSYGIHSGLRFRRSEGTQVSKTGVAFNSLVGFVGTFGYHTGSDYHTAKGASIDFYATEAYTSGAQGTKIVLTTTPNGTTANAVALTIDQNQVATFSKLIAQSAAEITNTPTGTTQTITLKDGNHQTLALTSATGTVTVTLTVPSNVSAGTLIVEQHATTVRDLTWAVSAGTIKWMGAEPTWSGDATSSVRIVSWRYNGSVIYLASTDVAV